MLPFSTSLYHILNQNETNTKLYQNNNSKFVLQKLDDYNIVMQYSDTCFNSSLITSEKQSCSHLPISTRKDRFKDSNEYCAMYSYNGLIDHVQYSSIKRILKTINRWEFNIFALDRFASGCPLTYLSLHLFEDHDLINYFQLDISKVYKFFVTIERSYHPSNPYHNALHAADVTQAINCILQDKKVWCQLTKMDVLCSLLSTMCHDVDHPGFNNMFMNNSQHHLSLLYQKNSVLENHHWAFSLSVMKETNIFSHFDKRKWKFVMDTCRSLIRATDISMQNSYLSDFNKCLLPTFPRKMEKLNDEEKLLVLQMAIKCADICNPCRRWDISNCWAYLVTEEFFQQGDTERKISLPISPIMDREKTKLAVVQKDFISYLVLPLFRVWDQFIDSDKSRIFLRHLDSNQKMWQTLSNKSAMDSDNMILNSIQSLYDRIQLMHVMDFTKDHQLSHLQRLHLLIESNYLPEETQSHEESTEMDDNQNLGSIGLYTMTEMIEEGQTKVYHQCRRGSLPITLLSNSRDSTYSYNPKKTLVGNHQKFLVRRTSLQPGQSFTTSTSIKKNRNNSVNFIQYNEQFKFPTSSRRKSAPVIKANPVNMFDNISSGRRGSLTSYFCPIRLSSGLCSSQSQLFNHPAAHSMNDIQIPQVG